MPSFAHYADDHPDPRPDVDPADWFHAQEDAWDDALAEGNLTRALDLKAAAGRRLRTVRNAHRDAS